MSPLRYACFVLLLAPTLASPLPAQSLLSSGGLGFPLDAVDARTRALGSLGIGLFGGAVLPTDPAAAADLLLPEVTFTLQHSWVDLEGPAQPDAAGARFPVIGLAYPFLDAGTVTLTFGGVLDQRWEAVREREVELAEEMVEVTDRFVSDGGVSAIRLGFARRITPSLALGVSAGRFTGDVRRTFTRRFDSLEAGAAIPPFVREGIWSWGGPTVSGGAQLDVGEFLRVAGSVTWSGDLEAEPSEETAGEAATFSMPVEYRVGASGTLTPALDLVLGLHYADWAGTGDGEGEDAVEGRAIFGWGAGLELDELTLAGRSLPVRLGYRETDLPFPFDGAEPSESLFTAGLGLALVDADVSRARADVSLEVGDRSAGPLTESFWRATLSIRVGGF